jgi:SulP family sulfate permease
VQATPGEGNVSKESVARRLAKHLPLGSWRKDVPAGLVLGVESVPDGLASGLLAGVNPLYGLYGYMFGTVFGALSTSSAFMTVQATGAMSVVISDVPQVQAGTPDSARALFTLSVLTGIVMLGLGLSRLGWIVQWVPNAVLTGFINAVAVNIVLGQLGSFTGFDADGANRLSRSLDTVLHVSSWLWPSVLVGVVTIVVIVVAERWIGALGMVLAIVLGSLLAVIPGLDVAQLRDITDIPRGLPRPMLPQPDDVVVLALPALSLAFVGLVQGAAISRSIPNPDGTYPNPSGDFRGQGIANIGAGLLQGMPVGGSMSATAIVTSAGARSRLAVMVAGATMILVVMLLPGLVSFTAMPALAGLLMVVGVRTLKPDSVLMVWRTGPLQATVMTATFVLTLVIPLQYAVLIGVALSIILHVARQANRITLRQWTVRPDLTIAEDPAPAVLSSHQIVILRPYGSLFFAAAGTFEAALPTVGEDCRHSVVIISLRGKEDVGSTFINVLTRYAAKLSEQNSLLKVSGISERLMNQLTSTRAAQAIGTNHLYPSTAVIAESTLAARRDAERWMAEPE